MAPVNHCGINKDQNTRKNMVLQGTQQEGEYGEKSVGVVLHETRWEKSQDKRLKQFVQDISNEGKERNIWDHIGKIIP